MSCIVTKSKAFKDLYDSLNIDEIELRDLIYSYAERNNDRWPTKEEILSIINNTDTIVDASDAQIELRNSVYNTEKILNTREELDNYLSELNRFFPEDAISYYTNKDGKYTVNVANLENQKEMKEILDKAPRNSDGELLAPNGKVSNLTERQYAQVRTKAFLNWFGDWINSPETASKVVDENGEPKIFVRSDDFNSTELKLIGGLSFATDNLDVAASYASENSDRFDGYVNFKNPYIVKEQSHGFYIGNKSAFRLKEDLINKGYDGIIFEKTWDAGDYMDETGETEYWATNVVFFNKNQFKSATSNKGTFSLEEDTIYKEESAPKKVTIRKKEAWRDIRGGEIIANLPQSIRDLVANDIGSYMQAKSEGTNNTKAFNSYFSENKETTASSILDKIIETSVDENIVVLAKMTRANLKKDVKVKYEGEGTDRGQFGTDGVVYIYNNASRGNNLAESTNGLERTIIHEIIHSIASDAINSNPKFKKEIANIMGQLSDYMTQNGIDVKAYALKNEHEFISEFMSQPLLREALKQMPYKETNFFSKIWNAILSAISGGKWGNKSLYDKAEKVFEKIAKEDAANTIQQSYADKYIKGIGSATIEAINKQLEKLLVDSPTPNGIYSIKYRGKTYEVQTNKTFEEYNSNKPTSNGRYGFSVLKVIDSKGNIEYKKDNYKYTVFKEESLPHVEVFEGNWTREQVASQTDKVFLFGDNTNDRLNTYHVPTMTQAVIRGLPNAIGIDTKKDRGTSESSYFTDADFDVFKKQVDEAITQAKASGKTIVIPSGGIGTGKAMLQQKAPKLFEYLQQELNKLSEIQSVKKTWGRTAENSYEVSTAGDSRFSALNVTLKEGTTITVGDIEFVLNEDTTIENIYQNDIKQSKKGQPPIDDSPLNYAHMKRIYEIEKESFGRSEGLIYSELSEEDYNRVINLLQKDSLTKEELEDFSYITAYKQLWKLFAEQNPELIEDLRQKSADKVLTDKFANTRVSQARALSEILNESSKAMQATRKDFQRAEEVKKELDKTLGTSEEVKSEIKDTIKLAQEGVTYQQYIDSIEPFFTKEELTQIFSAVPQAHANFKDRKTGDWAYKGQLQVTSVSRNTDPVFFSKEIVNFLKENSEKSLNDPTRTSVIEIWSKHDGEPIQDILEACKKYRVAPIVSFSITSMGDTALEKGVMKYQDMLDRVKQLIENGTLNAKTTTVRLDPILIGETNMDKVLDIAEQCSNMGIKKFVVSLVQSYGYMDGTARDRHVTSGINGALAKEGRTYDWDKYYGRDRFGKINFKPKREYIDEIGNILKDFLSKHKDIKLETCAFSIPGMKASACLDPLIMERLVGEDVTRKDGTYDRDTSRPDCMCYGAHSDMFRINEKKCFSSCAYCYAGRSVDNPLNYYNEDGSLKDNPFTRVRQSDKTPSRYEGWTQEELMKEKQERQQNEESSEAVKKNPIREIENQKFMEEQSKLNTQFDNLLNSDVLSASDIADIAEQAVFSISDLLTDIQNSQDPNKIIQDMFNTTPDIDVTTASRVEITNSIGIKNLLEYARNSFRRGAVKSGSIKTIQQANLIAKNWDAILMKANSVFSQVENFGLITEKGLTIDEGMQSLLDDLNTTTDPDAIQEIMGSLQEHWQTESRTQDVISSMSELVKRELFNLYLKDEAGQVITSQFGIKRRVKARNAINSILRWTQGATNLEEMISKMGEKAATNTWITPLLAKLKDRSGTYTILQSQFYRTMYKPFQLYDVIVKEGDSWTVKTVNKDPATNMALKAIKALANIGKHPLVSNGSINQEVFKNLNTALKTMSKVNKEGIKAENIELFARAATYAMNMLGYSMDVNTMVQFVNSSNAATMENALNGIMNVLAKNLEESEYNPFNYQGGITGFLKTFLSPIMDKMEDVAISSFYDSGKMYQSYVTPSYLTIMFDKFHIKDEAAFSEFIKSEFGQYEWFKRQDARGNIGWKHEWIREMATNPKAREVFAHKVNLSYDKLNYMRGLNSMQYVLSVLNEYFSESTSDKEARVPAWFRIPMMSNKPSSEFIRFYSERGSNYKEVITNKLKKVFDQEVGRMQDVNHSDFNKKDQEFIKNYDINGKRFQFLNWMNEYLKDGSKTNTELGRLLTSKLKGESVDEALLNVLAIEAIKQGLEEHFQTVLNDYETKGLLKQAEQIKNVSSFKTTREAIENFLWNDFFASTQILEMTITDIAYYKDAEDLQKRLAQLHAPGIRGNKFATDFGGKEVSDGKERSVILTDFDGFKSNIIENVSIVFDKKIAEASEHLKSGYRAMKESILEQFEEINVADAQAYNSPTSYRKKAFIFGTWSRQAEEVYQRLKQGNYTFSDLQVAFQPLKPFVYGHAEKQRNSLMGKQRVPIQNKNSEYLLILADAILQGENTGRPNLLRAIYEIMEESADQNPTKGIDTVQFESAVKSGLQGKIDLREFANDLENGESNAKIAMRAAIYNSDGSYNLNSVHELDFDCYAIQQEVPAHFLNHEQAHGSQERYIIPSDLATFNQDGTPIYYNVEGNQRTASEFKLEYEQTISDNIEESIARLQDDLNLTGTRKEKNVALAMVLQQEVNSSPRYSAELSQAILLDENGEFRIPKGDPIQGKRIEQLLNSVVKNRINKQEIAGGPVVQVSNFGTSRELNIKFKNKNKPEEMLQTKLEFENEEFKNPEYKNMSLDDAYLKYLRDNQGGIAYMECFAPIYSEELFNKFVNPDGTIDIEAIDVINPDLLKLVGYRIPTEAKYSISPLKIVGFLPREAGDAVILPNDITLLNGSDFDVDKLYLQRLEHIITTRKRSDIAKELYNKFITSKNNLKYTDKSKISEQIEMFLDNPEKMRNADELMNSLWYEYKRIAYKAEAPTEGRTYRNNKIVNMTYEVLTHETSAEQMLNPGGFEEQKNTGYMIEAYKNSDISWNTLEKMSTSDLKALTSTVKNLCFFDVHTQFYKQNSTAGTILGMFAVQRIAHAALEGDGLRVNTSKVFKEPITICDMVFGGNMEFDMQYSKDGQLIGKVLGSLVASAADAVKDPVLNLMNINNDTANLLTGLIRLGMPFRDVALLLSQKVISDTMSELETSIVNGKNTSLLELINEKLKGLEGKYNITSSSTIYKEGITREALIEGLKSDNTTLQIKALNAVKRLSQITNSLKGPSYCTRFNSMSNAVGPLVIDNIMMEYKLRDFSVNIMDSKGNIITAKDIFDRHPILKSFSKSLDVAQSLLEGMPANSQDFRRTVGDFELNGIQISKDRKLLSKLNDFYQTYLLYQSRVLNKEDAVYFINDFVNDFISMDYKNREGYKDNALIQALTVSIDKAHEEKAILNVPTTGMENTDKERLSSAWSDLFKLNRELAESLIWYNIYRRGIGFSPETFISLLPNYIKERIEGYKETFTNFPSVSSELVRDQFIRNNASNNKLVPLIDAKNIIIHENGTASYKMEEWLKQEDVELPFYIKVKTGKNKFRLFKFQSSKEVGESNYVEISTLGNNGEFMEMDVNTIDKPITENRTIEETMSEVETPITEIQENKMLVEHSKAEVEEAQMNAIYDLMAELGNSTTEETKRRALQAKAEGRTTGVLYKMKLKDWFVQKLTEKGLTDKLSEVDDYVNKLC